LRQLVANWKVALDLERIGDLSKNIAKRALAFTGEPKSQQFSARLTQMVVFARQQLKNVVEAYLKRDADKAAAVWRRDAELDELYNSVFRELLTYMMEDPRNISYCTHLLFVAKNIERIGDHATNIAETVQFIVRGRMLGNDRPKADITSSMPPVHPGKA
jgi:phosphate transport system protein